MDAARPVESINKNLCWHGRHRALLLQAAPGHQASLILDCCFDTCLGGGLNLVDEVCRLRVVSTLSRFSNGTATSITSVPITSKSFVDNALVAPWSIYATYMTLCGSACKWRGRERPSFPCDASNKLLLRRMESCDK